MCCNDMDRDMGWTDAGVFNGLRIIWRSETEGGELLLGQAVDVPDSLETSFYGHDRTLARKDAGKLYDMLDAMLSEGGDVSSIDIFCIAAFFGDDDGALKLSRNDAARLRDALGI